MENIGALWITNGKKGEFWKGNIEIKKEDGKKEKVNVMVFRNKKNKDTQPDFRICKPDEQKQDEEILQSDDLPF